MSLEKYELHTMEDASFSVQFSWTMGALAEELGITKKALRKMRRILTSPILKDETATFRYGFASFILKKKNKRREILAPHPEVQNIFRAIGKTLSEKSLAHKKAFGFVKKKNVQKATRTLLGNTHFFSFDIAEAFPSITASMIEESFAKVGFGKEIIAPLTWLVTYYYNGQRRLPQGSSCSPPLLNLVYKPMCQEIDAVCKKHQIKWFVYADDFNFAAKKRVPPEITRELWEIPAKFGFAIKEEKNKDNLGKTIPHMLGLTVIDRKIHVRRSTKKKIRRILYMAWKYDSYSPGKVAGVVGTIYQTYGKKETNWPGWVRKFWDKYREKHPNKKGGRHEK